jgi:predicted MFS family arabinose efflux permease
MLPVFARDVLDVGSTGLGWLMAASGFGGLTGSLLYASYGRKIERQGRLLIGTGVFLGFILTAFALSPWLPLSLVLVCLTAMTTSVYNSVNNTIIQMTVADEFRGRVMSVYLMTWGLMPFGTLPLGIMAGRIGAPFALTIQALLTTVVVVLVALRLPRMRALTAAQPA